MSDLRGGNEPKKADLGSAGKIIGAAIVAAVVIGVGAYSYENGTFTRHPHQQMASNQTTQQQP